MLQTDLQNLLIGVVDQISYSRGNSKNLKSGGCAMSDVAVCDEHTRSAVTEWNVNEEFGNHVSPNTISTNKIMSDTNIISNRTPF
jgi:hypothetical protein